MITVEQTQQVLDTLRAENRTLRRLVERRKQQKQHLSEYGYERKDERPDFSVPGLDEALVGADAEAEELMEFFRL